MMMVLYMESATCLTDSPVLPHVLEADMGVDEDRSGKGSV